MNDYDPEWEKEKKKINKRLFNAMEAGQEIIDLAYFTEAMMWYEPQYLEELGLTSEVYYNTVFYITPNNRHVYLALAGRFYRQDTLI